MSLDNWSQLRKAVCYGNPDKLVKAVWSLEWAYEHSLDGDLRSSNREMALAIGEFLTAIGVL